MARRDLDAFDTWFAELRDARTRSFAIALAGLDGQPYEDVARAAEGLRRRLDPPPAAVLERDDAPVPDRRRYFQNPRALLLEQVRANVAKSELWREYGRIPAHLVSYKDHSYPHRVISHVWSNFQIHDLILDWLTELVDEPSEPVRVQVATTLGVIRRISFHHIRETVVNEWAGSADPSRREAAAYLLRVPADDPRLESTVRSLVDRWLQADDERLKATAIRTLGLSWLSTETADAVAKLRRVAKRASWTVVEAIALSFIDLLGTDDRRFAPGVLKTLLAWFEDRETMEAASLVFLLVAHDLVEEQEGGPPDAPVVRWPGLLWLGEHGDSVRDPLVRCWCRTLAQGAHTEIAEKVIDEWAKLAERNPATLVAFTRLARAIGATEPRAREDPATPHQSLA